MKARYLVLVEYSRIGGVHVKEAAQDFVKEAAKALARVAVKAPA